MYPSFHAEPDLPKNKITSYLTKSNSNETQSRLDAKPTTKREGPNKAEELELLIKEKDKLISDLKNKKIA